jgi:hypothetical protein
MYFYLTGNLLSGIPACISENIKLWEETSYGTGFQKCLHPPMLLSGCNNRYKGNSLQ